MRLSHNFNALVSVVGGGFLDAEQNLPYLFRELSS
jgi:hypothetical protein